MELRGQIVPLLKNGNGKNIWLHALRLFGRLELSQNLPLLVQQFHPAFLLHFAAECGNLDTCSLLVRCGFSPEEKDSVGRSPAEITSPKGRMTNPFGICKASADPMRLASPHTYQLELKAKWPSTLTPYEPNLEFRDKALCTHTYPGVDTTYRIKISSTQIMYQLSRSTSAWRNKTEQK